MQRIHPITVEQCRPHYGKPVLLYLTDGSEISGVLSRVAGGKLYLNERLTGGQTGTGSVVKLKKKAKTKARIHGGKKASSAGKTVVSAIESPAGGLYAMSGDGYGLGGALIFESAAIAVLFALG